MANIIVPPNNPVSGEPQVQVYAAPAYPDQPHHPVTIVNHDPTNSVFYADHPGKLINQSSYIEAASIEVFDGTRDIWMATLQDNVSVVVDVKIGSLWYGAK